MFLQIRWRRICLQIWTWLRTHCLQGEKERVMSNALWPRLEYNLQSSIFNLLLIFTYVIDTFKQQIGEFLLSWSSCSVVNHRQRRVQRIGRDYEWLGGRSRMVKERKSEGRRKKGSGTHHLTEQKEGMNEGIECYYRVLTTFRVFIWAESKGLFIEPTSQRELKVNPLRAIVRAITFESNHN